MTHFLDDPLRPKGQEPRTFNRGDRLDMPPYQEAIDDYTIAPSEPGGADYFDPDHMCAYEIGTSTQSCWICRGRQELAASGMCLNCFGDGFTWSSISSIVPDPPERIPCPVCGCAWDATMETPRRHTEVQA